MTDVYEEFEMTEDDLQKLIEVCKPVPMIMLQCGTPLSQQDAVNAAWAELGERMEFDGSTVRPCGSNPRRFTARPTYKCARCDGTFGFKIPRGKGVSRLPDVPGERVIVCDDCDRELCGIHGIQR